MSDFTVENEDYKLTAKECRLPATVEKSRTAARIIGWGRAYNVRWRAPFMEVARHYMALLDSPRSERGFIGAAVRTFVESEIDGLTARFVETFQITGRGTHDSTASESSLDKTWVIVADIAAPVVWPQQNSAIERRKRSDAYCRLITDALKASDLTITSSFGAMVYVLLLSDELDPESLDESGIRILDYQGGSSIELEGLGKSLNQIGITIDHALSYCEDSRQISFEFWNFLAMFVGKEAMRKIREYVVGPIDDRTLINRLENTISLSPGCHCEFNDGLFILEPLTQDGSSLLAVDLSKFAEAEIPAKYPVRYTKLPGQIKPLATRGAGLQGLSIDDLDPYELDQDPDVVNARIYNQSMDRALRDGEIVWLETDNPDLRPLPHPHLLWLHANISRVVRMCGRSGEYVYAPESDEEEEPGADTKEAGEGMTSFSPEYQIAGGKEGGIEGLGLAREEWSMDDNGSGEQEAIDPTVVPRRKQGDLG
ncbi:hypothetical protein TWF970_001413 [Orbilia oligospora]|uniref:HNH nuclease domain-containing protein n=1 Tax=Orbilia oligospora TaxID=2813651 RepID=A0A7C8RDB2_ORBOL|nr:hypothetical protein TWF970_001413 [Orbilia oligospora]